ncbi:MAG: hypothetical protein ACREBE_15740, partial [bacterium]
DCAMIVPPDEPVELGINPRTKCCTFLPDLWNFLVGGVLLDEHADAVRGRATVEARLEKGVAVTPLGLGRDARYSLVYRGSLESFGRSRDLLCPHYIDEQGGLCGVWRHRESTCTTWFCKLVRGQVGKEFWGQLHQLLRAAEESVAAWCLLELGVDHGVLERLFVPHRETNPIKESAQDAAGEIDPAAMRAIWGKWLGREREFYAACARLVAPLTWADVVRIGGSQLAVYARLTQVAHSRLVSTAIPDHPVAALVQITPRAAGRSRLATYSKMDVLDVPSVVTAVLPYFDGRPTAEALAEIRRTEGVNIDPSLVRKLTDFGVLKDLSS